MSRPIAGRARRWRRVSAPGTRWTTSSAATTSAVIVLRTLTAVATSTPWSNATRAATWFAPIMSAIRSSVANAVPESAVAPAGRPVISRPPRRISGLRGGAFAANAAICAASAFWNAGRASPRRW